MCCRVGWSWWEILVGKWIYFFKIIKWLHLLILNAFVRLTQSDIQSFYIHSISVHKNLVAFVMQFSLKPHWVFSSILVKILFAIESHDTLIVYVSQFGSTCKWWLWSWCPRLIFPNFSRWQRLCLFMNSRATMFPDLYSDISAVWFFHNFLCYPLVIICCQMQLTADTCVMYFVLKMVWKCLNQ